MAGARLALACLAASLATGPSAAAQTVRDTSGSARLSRSADLALDERAFTRDDTLFMGVTPPELPSALDGAALANASGSWTLATVSEVGLDPLGGSLARTSDGYVASLALATLPEGPTSWTWSARLDWDGGSWSRTLDLTIGPARPHADFSVSVSTGVLPLAIDFADRSSGTVTSWSWNFGDGSSSSLANPTHVYTQAGTYSVALAVANQSGGDTRTQADLVLVNEPDFAIRYGMNASENVWSQRGIAFADAMARASEFCRVANGAITRERVPCIPLGQDPPLLGAGWPDLAALAPLDAAGARLFGNMNGSMPDGRTQPYVLTWEGTGSCQLAGAAVVSEANRSANRVEVFVDPTAAGGNALLFWELDASSPDDPVRNAHVWLPGMEATRPILWPPFVAKLGAMSGGHGPEVWRAMDWNEVNQYGRADGAVPFVFDLAGRITPASPSQGTRRGVCPEFQVALCNALGCNLHFNVPHPANGMSDADYETFLRDAFTAIRDGSPAVPGINGDQPFAPLAPGHTVTIELSNELWNPGFPVNAWLKTRAQASGLTLAQQAAAEIGRVFRIAEQVFAGEDAARLRRFVGGWMGDPSYMLEVLATLGPSVQVDAVGPACYFGPRKEDISSWLNDSSQDVCPNCPTPEMVVLSARQRIQDLDLKLLEHRIIADFRLNPDGSTPKLELYEGGSSFVAGFQPWGGAANQAQRLPSMFDAYVLDFIPMLVARRVDVVMWYSFISDGNAQGGSAGPFGHWETMDQTITLPVPDVYVDEGAPRAAAVYRLPPRRSP